MVKYCEATKVSLHLRCSVIIVVIDNVIINAGWYCLVWRIVIWSRKYRTNRIWKHKFNNDNRKNNLTTSYNRPSLSLPPFGNVGSFPHSSSSSSYVLHLLLLLLRSCWRSILWSEWPLNRPAHGGVVLDQRSWWRRDATTPGTVLVSAKWCRQLTQRNTARGGKGMPPLTILS